MNLLPTLAASAAALAFAMPAAGSVYVTSLSGLNENPINASPATGFARVTIDEMLSKMRVETTFDGLTGGNASAAHIHCCVAAPGVVAVAVGFPGFPAAPSGVYDHVFDMTSSTVYTASFLNVFGGGTALGAFNALKTGLDSGTAYVNIHNRLFPAGEVRGFLAVSEPPTWALTLGALGIVGAAARRRRVPT